MSEEVANVLWYHTIEIAPGVVTPGWFDLRSIVNRLPWPDVKGKRCLDVGTYDGFLAFEMERRGASEVVATDIAHHEDWDWPPDVRATGGENLAKLAGEKGKGFEIAAKALGSKVDRQWITVYDLSPERMGTFDVVTCGSLMLHLRDPMRALEAIRSVCGGMFMSSEEIEPVSTVVSRRPMLKLNGSGPLCQWLVPNQAGHQRMVFSAGFQIVKAIRPYANPFGVSHPPRSRKMHQLINYAAVRLLTGREGVLHSAVLARPRV